MTADSDWRSSPWVSGPGFITFRRGRFVVVELHGPHRVATTSSQVGGMTEGIRHLVNHQSCEGSGHNERFVVITGAGPEAYHDSVCAELLLPPGSTAVMGTAANMIYAAHQSAEFENLRVDAIVTGGVEGNAATSGDPSQWVETPEGWTKAPQIAGTINTMVMINQPLKPEAQIRAILTATEGKSAALLELGISSRYSPDLATGTGTDQMCLASPLAGGTFEYSATNPHSKLGELIGAAVRAATKDALRWQNGLEPSFTRSLSHALRRFGFSDESLMNAMRTRLSDAAMVLLEKNKNAVVYEPQLAAAAYALAAVLDRVRYGTLPSSAAGDVVRQQAATLAASLAARPESWYGFWLQLNVNMACPLDVVYDAVAMGWTAKWESKA